MYVCSHLRALRRRTSAHRHACAHLSSTILASFSSLFGLLLLVGAVCLGSAPAGAQTAHFRAFSVGSGFNNTWDVAVDSSGNLFVADTGNNAIKEITAASNYGTVTTLGSGFNLPEGVAVDASGNVFVADDGNGLVKEILAAGGYTTVKTLGSGFTYPTGVAVDSNDNVFVSDNFNGLVKEITAASGYTAVNTLGTVVFQNVHQIAVDASDNVYVANSGNNQVMEMTAASGYSTVNSLGSGFSFPLGVAVDANGNVYVSDYNNSAVKEITAASNYTTVDVLGSGFNQPNGIAVGSKGEVFVAADSNYVEELANGAVSLNPAAIQGTASTDTLWFTFDSGGAIGAPLVVTQGVTQLDFTDAGTGTCTTNGTSHTYSAGNSCAVVVSFTPKHPGTRYGAVELTNGTGAPIVTAYVDGSGLGPQVAFSSNNIQSVLGSGFNLPAGAAVDASGNVFVADTGNSAVKEILAAGGYTTVNSLGSGLKTPTGVALDGAGNVFVADYGNNDVKELVAASGYTAINTLGNGLTGPYGVAVDASGNLFVTELGNSSVQEILAEGGYTTMTSLGGGFDRPEGIAVDANDNVFVADESGSVVDEILSAGGYSTMTTVGGGFTFSFPQDVAVDGNGNLFVADSAAQAVEEILASGGYTNVQILGAVFSDPGGMAVDGSGNVFVADTANNAVKRLDFTDPPSLGFGPTYAGGASGPQTVTVTNNGNQALTFVLPTTGTNPSVLGNFAWDDTSTCGQTNTSSSQAYTLGASVSCTVAIDFTPESIGTFSGSVMLADTSLNSSPSTTQSISLSGTGTEPPVTQLAFAAAPPANIPVGANAGSAVTVDEEEAGGSVDTYASDTITLTVSGPNSYLTTYTAPASSGIATFNLSSAALMTAGSYTYTASLSGVTSAVATETVDPAAYTAPVTSVGTQSATQTATLALTTNFTLGSIAVLTQGATGLDFQAAAGGTCTVGQAYTAGQACTVNYTFNPTHPGARDGAVVLYNNSSPVAVVATAYLQGTGTGAQAIFSSNNLQSSLGSGFSNPFGIAVDGAGNVFVSNYGNSTVDEIPAAGGYATVNPLGGGFSNPQGIALDGAGNVFVADTNNNAVKEIPSGCTASTCVLTLGSGFSQPGGVAIDGSGNVYVADAGNHAVKEIFAAGGYTTVQTLSTAFTQPSGVAIDGNGNLFVTDYQSSAASELLAAGGYTTINPVGSGLSGPTGIAVDAAGNVFVANQNNNAVDEILSAGGYTTIQTLGSGFFYPSGVAVDAAGNVFVADNLHQTVTKLDYRDAPSLSFAKTQAGKISTDSPKTITVANDGNQQMSFSAVTYATDFPEAPGIATDCAASAPVASGATCTLSVDFSPQAASATGASTALTEAVSLSGANLSGSANILPVAVNGTETIGPPVGWMFPIKDATTGGTTAIGQSDSFTVSGAAGDPHDGTPVQQVQILIDGNVAGSATLGAASTGLEAAYNNPAYARGGWTFTSSASGLSLGTHTVKAVATDSVGLSTTLSTATITVAALSAGPPVGWMFPVKDATTGGTTAVGQNDKLNVSGTAGDPHDGTPVQQVQILIDGNVVGTATLGAASTGLEAAYDNPAYARGGWSFTTPASTLSLGSHTVTAVASDTLGLSVTLGTETFTVAAVSAGPPVGWMFPVKDGTTGGSTAVGQNDKLNVSGTAGDPHDGTPVQQVQILIDGNVVGTATLGAASTGLEAAYNNPAYARGGWSFTTPASTLSLGTHTVSAVASDTLGLSATLGTETFTVAAVSAGPPVGWVFPVEDATTGSTTAVSVTDNLKVTGVAGDPHDGTPVQQVQILIDGSVTGIAALGQPSPGLAVTNYTNPAYANGGWTFTGSVANLTLGTHTLKAVASDSLGLSTILGTETFTVSAPSGLLGAYEIDAWGDSLTQGNEDSTGITFPKKLAALTGQSVHNYGIGAQTSSQIAVRMNAYSGQTEQTFAAAFTLPTSGTVNVTFPAGFEPVNTQYLAAYGVKGIPISFVAGGQTYTGYVIESGTAYVFTPIAYPAAPVSVPAGTGWLAVLPSGANSGCVVIWAGRNNYANGTQVQEDIAAMVAAARQTTSCYVVLSVPNGDYPSEWKGTPNYNTIIALNNALAGTYSAGNHYLDIRADLIGLYNPNDTADVVDHTLDLWPYSLRAQDVSGSLTAPINSSTSCAISGTAAVSSGYIISENGELIEITGGSNGAYSCVRGYAGTTAGTDGTGATFTAVDPIHLGQNAQSPLNAIFTNGYQAVAAEIYAWLQANGPK